jgi:hypothetical protein
MAKKSSKPAKKSTARNRSKARSTGKVRAAKRPARRSTKATRTVRGKHAAKRRSSGKLASRGSLRTKKRLAPKAGSRTPAKGKVSSKARENSKLIGRKLPPKISPKVIAKPAGKLPAKASPIPGKPGIATAPVKPSAGEIAARLSARRTEKALAEGKVRSGKNGGVELRKV